MDKTSNEISDFVGKALEKRLTRASIQQALTQAGWREEQIARALDDFAEVDFPVPVPKPKPLLRAREAFFYLLLFTTLYISAFNFGKLLFVFIERAFPDPAFATVTIYHNHEIRSSISALIVAFPVFLYLSRKINRELLTSSTGRASGIRRWLTYITLFIAASIIIGDLIVLVNNLLGGELTLRFILKSLVVGGIAGTLFIHYLKGLKPEERKT